MNSKALITTLLLICIPAFLFSKDKIVSMKKLQTEVFLDGFFVADIINISGEEYYIGYKLNTASFDKESVRFEHKISDEFKTFLAPVFKENGSPLTIRINHIFHYQVLLEETMLIVTEMNLSFVQKHGSTFTELYHAAVSIRLGGNQAKIVGKAIEMCLTDFNNRAASGKLNTDELPMSDLMKNPLDNLNIEAFMKVDRKQKAIYWTYDDFFYDTPDRHSTFEVKYQDRINRHDSLIIKHAVPKSELEHINVEDAWGFADGERIFVRAGKKFFPLIHLEDGLYLKFKTPNSGAAVSAAVIGGILGGIIGAAVAGVAVGIIPGTTNGEQLLKLDLNTGNFDIFIEPENKLVQSRLIFFSSAKNEDEMELTIDGIYQCKLKPDSWFEIFLPSTKSVVKTTLSSDGGKVYEKEVTPRLFYRDIYICYERGKKPPYFRKLTDSSAESTLKDLTEENKID